MKHIQYFMIALLVLAAPPDTAAQVPPLSLDRAIELFLDRNVEVQAARFQVDRARAGGIAAKLRPNPTLTVAAENFRVSGATPFSNLYEVSAIYTDTIERGHKRELRQDVAGLELTVAEAAMEDVLRQKIAELRRAFLEALLAHQKMEIAKATHDTLDEVVRLNGARFEAGAIPEGDLLKVRLERVRTESSLLDAQHEEIQAMIRVLEKLEEADLAVRPIAGSLDAPLLDLDLKTLRDRALATRPDLKAAASQVGLNRARLSLERARATPELAPFVGYKRTGANNTIIFGITMPLSTRNRNEGAIARAAADEKLAKGQTEVVENRVVVDVESAFRAYESARSQVVLFRDQLLRQADEAQAIALAAYEEGATELLPVLDAQRTRSDIQKEYLQKLFNYRASLVDLELAVGGKIQ